MPKVETIRERLNGNLDLALREGDAYFARRGSVWNAFRRIGASLDAHSLPYVETDHLAMFHHGFREYTETIELLVTAAGFDALRIQYQEFQSSTHPWAFIEPESGVPIVLHLEGTPVRAGATRYPNPATCAEIAEGLRFIRLTDLVSLKLARCQHHQGVSRDLADVEQLILAMCLTQEFANELNGEVRDAYRHICGEIDASCGQFLLLWEAGKTVSPSPSFDELVAENPEHEAMLRAMQRDGVEIWTSRPSYRGHAVLSSSSRAIARKYDMHHESEHWFSE